MWTHAYKIDVEPFSLCPYNTNVYYTNYISASVIYIALVKPDFRTENVFSLKNTIQIVT